MTGPNYVVIATHLDGTTHYLGPFRGTALTEGVVREIKARDLTEAYTVTHAQLNGDISIGALNAYRTGGGL